MRKSFPGLFLLLLLAGYAHAQNFATGPCPDFHDDGSGGSWFFGHQEHVCELRRTILPLSNGQVEVSATNGNIEVIGEDRRDVALEARVEAQGSSRGDAESALHEIRVLTNGTIRAVGPQGSGWLHGGWSVSYRLHVPRHLNARVNSENGTISVSNIEGGIDASTTNGAMSLDDLGGDLHASTVNGGISVQLAGDRWRGPGLSAKTVNGGISVKAPNGYSAHVNANTVNGSISVGFPITVQGAINHNLDTNMGQGGATLAFETVNGGIAIARGGNATASTEE